MEERWTPWPSADMNASAAGNVVEEVVVEEEEESSTESCKGGNMASRRLISARP